VSDICSVHDPVYKRAFGDAVRALELEIKSAAERRSKSAATCGPVGVDANGAPVEDA